MTIVKRHNHARNIHALPQKANYQLMLYHLTPLSDLQQRLLELLCFSTRIYTICMENILTGKKMNEP